MVVPFDLLADLIGGYFYPFVRISAFLLAAPVFGARSLVFVLHRLSLAIALTVIVVSSDPGIATGPAITELSLWIVVNEMVLGLAMGLILQMVFDTLVIAGESIALTMGLGFATFIDPTNGTSVPVVSKLYLMLGVLIFFGVDGHLVSLQILVEGFHAFPVAHRMLAPQTLMLLVLWGGQMFIGALLIALPCLAVITLINIAFGVMTRAAPQMNIFSVGFPTTLAAGFVVMNLSLPTLLPRFTEILMSGFSVMRNSLL